MTPEKIEELFNHKGQYRFARWGRPIVPVVFGVDDESLNVMKDAMARTVGVTGGALAETDPELGANFMWFFITSWQELLDVPKLEELIPGLPDLIEKLAANNSEHYRSFNFDADGAIKFCVTLFNMSGPIADLPIQVLVTGETVQAVALWGPNAFDDVSPIATLEENGLCVVKPEFASLIRAAYDPAMPNAADDPSHAMRLAPRAAKLLADMSE